MLQYKGYFYVQIISSNLGERQGPEVSIALAAGKPADTKGFKWE